MSSLHEIRLEKSTSSSSGTRAFIGLAIVVALLAFGLGLWLFANTDSGSVRPEPAFVVQPDGSRIAPISPEEIASCEADGIRAGASERSRFSQIGNSLSIHLPSRTGGVLAASVAIECLSKIRPGRLCDADERAVWTSKVREFAGVSDGLMSDIERATVELMQASGTLAPTQNLPALGLSGASVKLARENVEEIVRALAEDGLVLEQDYAWMFGIGVPELVSTALADSAQSTRNCV